VAAPFEAKAMPPPEVQVSSSIDADTLAMLKRWQGKSHTSKDQITLAPVRGLSAMLDREDSPPQEGDVLPPLWHWLFFLSTVPQSGLGQDGHPQRGGFLPPVPLPRRMWAGGHLHWHQPIRLGQTLERTSSIESVQHKTGRSGELLFVQVLHRYRHEGVLCLEETHDIVYRSMPSTTQVTTSSVAPSPPESATWQRTVVPDDVLLFRYSALTFNSHRIHYDRRYATTVEGYPGLVVHGPLMATLLVDLLRQHDARPLQSFSFKVLKPVFECADQRLITLHARPQYPQAQAWVSDHEHQLCLQATAQWATD
jgi:3-methylfumaryl-CoA hydratase